MHVGPWGLPFIDWHSEFLSYWIHAIPKGQDYWLPEVAIFTSNHGLFFSEINWNLKNLNGISDQLRENRTYSGPWVLPFIVWHSEFLSFWIHSIPKGRHYWFQGRPYLQYPCSFLVKFTETSITQMALVTNHEKTPHARWSVGSPIHWVECLTFHLVNAGVHSSQ